MKNKEQTFVFFVSFVGVVSKSSSTPSSVTSTNLDLSDAIFLQISFLFQIFTTNNNNLL